MQRLRAFFYKIIYTTCSIVLLTYQSFAITDIDNPRNKKCQSIAVVDLQFISENALAVKNLNVSIKDIERTVDDKNIAKWAKLRKIEHSILGKKNKVDTATFLKLVKEFEKKVLETRREIEQEKVKLEKMSSEAMSKIYTTTQDIIEEFSREHNVDLVLSVSQLFYAKKQLDITKVVLEKLNERLKFVNVYYD